MFLGFPGAGVYCPLFALYIKGIQRGSFGACCLIDVKPLPPERAPGLVKGVYSIFIITMEDEQLKVLLTINGVNKKVYKNAPVTEANQRR